MAGNVPNELHNQAGLTQLWAQKGHRNYRNLKLVLSGQFTRGTGLCMGVGQGTLSSLGKVDS